MKRYSVSDYNAHDGTDIDAGLRHSAVLGIREISRIISSAASRATLPDKMSDSMKSILFFLAENNGATQLEIVEKTELKAPTVSVSLKNLESLGYVTRNSDLADLRLHRVYLTDKGVLAAESYKKAISDAESACFKNMSKDEISDLYELTSKVLYNLQKG